MWTRAAGVVLHLRNALGTRSRLNHPPRKTTQNVYELLTASITQGSTNKTLFQNEDSRQEKQMRTLVVMVTPMLRPCLERPLLRNFWPDWPKSQPSLRSTKTHLSS
ncbi:hypothetical protein BIW11_03781 [Tropilaelaps mercedesae]|uniref:Uncharacterized protein n=1 Tax=Tropilaelaps mercedesae TaxID=418985 RepID=A0A1V9XFX1_9ACAR|nr:hypothetical protein BIW11_03781 [Tropilaelaps mercedesae]